MLAVAGVGYESEYRTEYESSVSSADLKLIQQLADYLTFAEGEGGALSGLFTVLPAWLPLNNGSGLRRYFNALEEIIRKETLSPIVVAFPEADWDDRMMRRFLEHPEIPGAGSKLAEPASELADCYLRNFSTYESEVWPIAENRMRERIANLNEFFSQRDYIAAWEQLLGLQFQSSLYWIVVCFANKNGPDYNSLGYSGNLFYYDKPFDRTWQFVSHEIGTHLLIDSYFDLSRSGKYKHRPLYAAYESLAMFYNRQLLGLEHLAYSLPQMDDGRHLEFYAEHSAEGLAPTDLLRIAVENFSKDSE